MTRAAPRMLTRIRVDAPITRWAPTPAPSRTTAVQVEFAVSVCVAALRMSTVVQMLPSVRTGYEVSARPAAYLLLWSVAVAACVAVSLVSLRRRRPLPPAAIAADLALGVVLIIASGATIPLTYRLGSWVGWTGAYALAIAMTAGPLRSLRQWAVGVVAVVLAYGVYIAPLSHGRTLSTVIGNVIGYVVLAGTVRLIIVFVRRISDGADRARAEVARLAQREEEHRAQLAFHDATTVMHLLSDPTLPAELRSQLQVQAVAEVRRMRDYLSGRTGAASGVPGTLCDAVRRACDGFADLDVQTRTDLVSGVRIGPAAADAVADAVRTVLHNVRRHARASTVVVHGAVDRPVEPSTWTITVHDDGCGFDRARTALGVGLRSQVIEELGRHGIECRIDSVPGSGTTVALSGAL